MTKRVVLVADDFGISPSVNGAIIELIAMRRLSGTGCMTVFPEWREQAERLKPLRGRTAIGIHLTLTDQAALSGTSSLAPDGCLPRLSVLATPAGRNIRIKDIHAELDSQVSRFTDAFGQSPDYIDGHQHVHFLPPVRSWLLSRFGGIDPKPSLRGAPSRMLAVSKAGLKVLAVRSMARGYEVAMASGGFRLLRPLRGIYDLGDFSAFEAVLARSVSIMQEGELFMCHPGRVDALLRKRDPLQDAREAELAYLASDQFMAVLKGADAVVRAGL